MNQSQHLMHNALQYTLEKKERFYLTGEYFLLAVAFFTVKKVIAHFAGLTKATEECADQSTFLNSSPARLKFQLTNQDSAGGKNFTVLTSM